MNPTSYSTRSLVVHPAVKALPMLPAESPEARGIAESIRQIGLLEALKLHKGRVVDGRERLRAALELGLETVPCVEICEGDLHTVILHSLTARKHLTKSAVAYLGFPHLEPALKESKARHLEMLKSGGGRGEQSALNALCSAKTAEDLAEQLGISRRLFFMARNVHGHFGKNIDLVAKFEALILHGEPNADDVDHRRPYSLARVLQGIAGYNATYAQSKPEREQLLLWNEKIKGFSDPRKWAGWDKATAEVKDYVRRELRKAIETWPEDVREAVFGAA